VPGFHDGLVICLSSPEDAAASDPPTPGSGPGPGERSTESPQWKAPEIVVIRTRANETFLWAKGNVAPARYAWERREAGGSWQPAGETATFFLNDTGLSSGTTYEYRARALPAPGEPTAWSSSAAATPTRRNALRDLRHAFARWPELRLAAGALLAAAAILALWLRFRERAPSG